MIYERDQSSVISEFTEFYPPNRPSEVFKFDNRFRFLVSETGFGMPPINYISKSAPFQHGETFYDYRLEKRIIQMVFRENACSRARYWYNRQNLIYFFRPNWMEVSGGALGVLTRRFRGLNTDTMREQWFTRCIQVMVEQGPEFRARDLGKWDEWSIYETIRFVAPDPTFYEPTTITTYKSGAQLAEIMTITYSGGWKAYPLITLTGPITNPIVWHGYTTTLYGARTQKLDFTGLTIQDGQRLVIDSNFFMKTVRLYTGVGDTIGVNAIGYMLSTSDFADFYIYPHPQALSGTNTIYLQYTNAPTGDSRITVSYSNRFVGF